MGVPAKQIGWMSEYGEQLALPLHGEGVAICKDSGVRYRLQGLSLTSTE